MSRDYEDLQAAGNRAGLEKLMQNEHKSGFDDIDINYAMKRLEQERDELWAEIIMKDKNFAAIRSEAADVRNICDMIIYKCDKELGLFIECPGGSNCANWLKGCAGCYRNKNITIGDKYKP